MSEGIEAWMRNSGEGVRGAAEGLRELATDVGTAETGLSSTLLDAATAMGWEGQLQSEANLTSQGVTPLIRRLADSAQAAGNSLGALATSMDEHGPEVVSLEGQLAALRADPPTMQMQDTVGTVEVIDYTALREQEDRLLARLEQHTERLHTADGACLATLSVVQSDLMALVPPGTTPQWTRSMVPPEVWGLFQTTGVVDTIEEEELAAQIDAQTTAPQLRELLEDVPVERLEMFLARHPEALAILARDYDPAMDDPGFAALINAGGSESLSIPPDSAHVADIAAHWGSLSEEEQLRLRLLYPFAIGNLDGIDLENRALANRMLLRDAIAAERRWEATLDAGPTTEEWREQMLEDARENWWWNPISEWSFNRTGDFLTSDDGLLVGDVWHPDRELERSRARLALYESLLLDPPRIPHDGGLLGDDQRALLVFDPRGDGRFAEWNGSFDADNVGLFVPGTMTNMANVDGYNSRMLTIAAEHPSDTAMITWMGTDLPDAVVADAKYTEYSITGGNALTSFVEGLPLSGEQDLTLIGHSAGGGIVGAADIQGVDADRIFHIASAGTGPGISDAAQYPFETVTGAPRQVQRFSMTAPGDAIEVAQRSGSLDWLIPDDWGHGYDPDETPGFIRLETGRFTEGARQGEQISGLEAHSHVVQPGTDAFDNIVGVVRNDRAIPFQEEHTWGWTGRRLTNVYDDDDYAGTDPVPLEFMVPIGEVWEPPALAPGPSWDYEPNGAWA